MEETVNKDAIIEEEPFKHNECGFISKNYILNIHTKKTGEKLKCELCDTEFDSKRFLKIHTKTHSYNSYRRKYVFNKCEHAEVLKIWKFTQKMCVISILNVGCVKLDFII